MTVQTLLSKIVGRENLTETESEVLMTEILSGKLTSVEISAVLTALSVKGETGEELLGFIKVLRKNMSHLAVRGVVIDTCGTGGDGLGTFNISTASSLIAAAAGVKVAKHGNRNASSLCGSADVLEELGLNINLTPQMAEKLLNATGFVFLFAPLFHSSMKYVSPVRKELKIRTVFNFLGPFVNPAGTVRQIVGVPSTGLAEKLSGVALQLNYRHLLLVSSADGLDEISLSGETHLFEIRNSKRIETAIKPEDFGFRRTKIQNLIGGGRKKNAEIIRAVLNGDPGPQRDVVLLNSGAALYVSGKVKSIKEGVRIAEKIIDKGLAKKFLEKVITVSNSL